MRREIVGFALGGLVVIGALGAGMSIREDGLQFPDESIQTTAGILPASLAVQGTASATALDSEFCSVSQPLFKVPEGKRLVIEWLSARTFGIGVFDPVDIRLETFDGISKISHTLVRLTESQAVGGFLASDYWTSPVRLYSEGNETVEISHCRGIDGVNEHTLVVTFSGYLIDVPS